VKEFAEALGWMLVAMAHSMGCNQCLLVDLKMAQGTLVRLQQLADAGVIAPYFEPAQLDYASDYIVNPAFKHDK